MVIQFIFLERGYSCPTEQEETLIILGTFHHLSSHPLSPPHRCTLDTVAFLRGKNPISWWTGMLTHMPSAASIHQIQPVCPLEY